MSQAALESAERVPIVEPVVAPSVPDWDMSMKDWAAVIGASLGAFLAVLDIQITNASLREIQGALGLDFSEGGWISTSYLIAEIIVIPLTAYLSKIFGMRRYMLVNCAIFICASILCGCAWNMGSLIVFRTIQGFSGGTLIPMAFQSLLLFMPPQRKSQGLAIFGITATLAPTLGPTVGGWLTETFGWRSIFFMNIVPGAITYLTLNYGLPKSKMLLNQLKNIDIFGVLCLVIGLGTLTYVLEEGAKVEWFEDSKIRISFLLAFSTLPLFLVSQLISKAPLLDLKLLKNFNFFMSGMITTFTAMALYGGIYALSLYLGQVQHYSALQIGQVIMWVGIPQLIVMPLMPFMMKKFNLQVLALIGMVLFAFSNYLNSHLSPDYAGDQFKLSLMIRAIGQPMFMIPLTSIGMGGVLPSQAGNASSIFNMMRNLGGSMGIAMTGTLLITRQSFHAMRNLENVSAFNPLVTERLDILEKFFLISGFDRPLSKTSSLGLMVFTAQKEALISAFGDVFKVLCVCLLICVGMIMVMMLFGKNNNNNSTFEMH